MISKDKRINCVDHPIIFSTVNLTVIRPKTMKCVYIIH